MLSALIWYCASSTGRSLISVSAVRFQIGPRRTPLGVLSASAVMRCSEGSSPVIWPTTSATAISPQSEVCCWRQYCAAATGSPYIPTSALTGRAEAAWTALAEATNEAAVLTSTRTTILALHAAAPSRRMKALVRAIGDALGIFSGASDGRISHHRWRCRKTAATPRGRSEMLYPQPTHAGPAPSPIAASHVVAEQRNEDGGESGDPVSRPRRRCVCLACSRLATPLALPRRPSLTARFVLPRHASQERTHACAADLHQTRCA